MDAQQMLRGELDGRQRVFHFVGDLASHLRPRLELLGAFEIGTLTFQIRRHLGKAREQRSDLVLRRGFQRNVEISLGNAMRRIGERVDGLRDPTGEGVSERRRGEGETKRGEKQRLIHRRDAEIDFRVLARQR